MRTLLKGLLLLLALGMAARLAALVVSKRFDEGSEVSDEIQRMVCLNGLQFKSRARGLRRAEVSVVLGGATIDLSDAVIDPAGATVRLENTLGGLALKVRSDWAVSVEEVVLGGGEIEVLVTPAEDLPEDAPKLTVKSINRLGGTVITAGDIGR
jgi:predicted membrane protein